MKRFIIVLLIFIAGCDVGYVQPNPVIQQGWVEKERLEIGTATLIKEIEQFNQEREQLNEEMRRHYEEESKEYQERNNAFIMSLNDEQLELFKKVENESQSWSQTGSTSLSAGVTLAFRDFEKSLSEAKLQTWMDLSGELVKLQEIYQGLMVRDAKLNEQAKKLNRKREQLIQEGEQYNQFVFEYTKMQQQQQREIDRSNENYQRQLDRLYYGQPRVIPLSPQWPTYYRDAFGNYRPR